MKNGKMCVVSIQMSLKCTDEGVLVQTEINSGLLRCAVGGIDWMITPSFLPS